MKAVQYVLQKGVLYQTLKVLNDCKLILTAIIFESGPMLSRWYQDGVKSTVSGVFEDLKFKISEGWDRN